MRTVLVTGATDGIGRETARQMAASGWRVLLHGRSRERGEREATRIARLTGNAAVEVVEADFSSLEAVRGCAERLRNRLERLDVLVNNAGIYERTRRLSRDGFELTLAVNHLAPFLLTNLLLPLLKKSAPSRIINVSSVAHTRGRLDLDDVQLEHGYSAYGAYAASKLANVLFTYALAGRLAGTGVTVNCLHPGVIDTKLLREGFPGAGGSTVGDGASGSVYLATSPEVERLTGRYFAGGRERDSSPESHDRLLQERLWELSAKLTGLAPGNSS